MKRVVYFITLLFTLTACGRLDAIPYEPAQTPETWLQIQPYIEFNIGSQNIIFVQPSTSIIVYLLGVITVAVGSYFFRIQNGQRSRLWWGIALLPGGKSVTAMINDLAPQLSALGVNWWDQFDNDRVVYTSQGVQYRSVDMVVVLHAGPGKEATGQAGQVWSHASTANLNTGVAPSDNRQVRIRGVNTVPAIGFNIGVVAHEMGHTIGESDYYDTNYRSMGSGDWDLMAGGSWMGNDPAGSNPTHMNPFSKVNQGWVETLKVSATTLGIALLPRSVAPQIVEISLGGLSFRSLPTSAPEIRYQLT